MSHLNEQCRPSKAHLCPPRQFWSSSLASICRPCSVWINACISMAKGGNLVITPLKPAIRSSLSHRHSYLFSSHIRADTPLPSCWAPAHRLMSIHIEDVTVPQRGLEKGGDGRMLMFGEGLSRRGSSHPSSHPISLSSSISLLSRGQRRSRWRGQSTNEMLRDRTTGVCMCK